MKVLSRKRMAAGKFLALDLIEYMDDDGIVRKWESVSRLGCGGAVVIICNLYPSDEIVLVKQFRPPAGNIMLEFPAGLVEEQEDPAVAAVRELAEETGFRGKVKKILPPSFSSPGLTSEQVFWAVMEAPDTPESQRHTNFDESENIETVTVKRKELFSYLENAMKEGVLIDSKLFAYAAGLTPGEEKK